MEKETIDLSTRYLGLSLKNPLVASAGPLSRDAGKVRELEDAGVAAVVMFSLFEEEILHQERETSHFLELGTESFAESLSYLPRAPSYHLGPDEYLEGVRRLKESVEIPVIGSLNGITAGGWVEHAARIEQAGADALELNVYFIATDPTVDCREVEDRYLEVLRAVRSRVRIPVAMKLSPYFSSLPSFAQRLEEGGADGLVLFNRFYQPDIDLENLEVFPNLILSTSVDVRLPLHWIGILRGLVGLSLAGSSGVDRAHDVLKLLMVGADAAMVCSTLLRHGPGRAREILRGMREWMEEHEYSSVDVMRGSMSHRFSADPSAFERANYMKALRTFI